jgi:hypothetical protein
VTYGLVYVLLPHSSGPPYFPVTGIIVVTLAVAGRRLAARGPELLQRLGAA